MQKEISRKILKIRARVASNILLDVIRRVLFVVGAVVLVGIIAERLTAIQIFTYYTVWLVLATAATVVFVWWFLRLPSKSEVSLLIDARLKLKERLSSLIAFEDSKDVFTRAACQEASEKIKQTSIKGHFPVSMSSRWLYPVSMWVFVVGAVLFLPQYDLLGYLQKEEQDQRQAMEIELAEKLVETATGSVKLIAKGLGDEEVQSELEKLSSMTAEQSSEGVRRQAIQKLGALSDRIKQLESNMNAESLKITKKMLKQIRPVSDAFSRKLEQALAKGDFGMARDMIKQYQKELETGKMDEQQKRALSEQLTNLSKQLEQIAAKDKELGDELEKYGLDKELAKLSAEDLRKMLENQGLTPEQIEQIMQKLSACKMGCQNCMSLSQAMGSCVNGAGGLSADELGELVGQLSDMEAFEQQMKLMQASLAEIENAISCLGQGMCQTGAKGPWAAGQSDKYGPGSGGPGKGFGEVDKDTEGDTTTKATKVQNKGKEGTVVASWYFKGEQIKGESTKEFKEAIETAKENASEAITENQIPKRYEESVKKYFGGLEKTTEE
jgi:hypothetical protein